MSVILIRSILIYLLVLVVIRLMGKRQVGEMQPFELVITLIIADLACIPMSELSVPLFHGVVPILSLLVLHYLICFFSRKSIKAVLSALEKRKKLSNRKKNFLVGTCVKL